MRFSEVIGQEGVKRRLIKTVKDSRVSHAQLFLGDEGTGKLALALAYAQYINCAQRTDDDSCGTCPSCLKYEKLVHPDLHFIFPTAKIKKDDTPLSKNFLAPWRELLLENKCYISLPEWFNKIGIERKQAIINAKDCSEILHTLSYKTYEADYKVMIIWMVEKLFHAAAPKILKILEEPPDNTLFILISEDQLQVIKTILSRTQLVKIPGIGRDELTLALKAENFDPGQINDAVKLANGNYLEARRVLLQAEDEKFNFVEFSKWMRLCFNGKVNEIVDFIAGFSKHSREKQKDFLNYVLRLIRESMLINNGLEETVRINKDEAGFIYGAGTKRFYPYVNSRNSALIAKELNDAIYHIERNANANVLFLDLSLKLGTYLKM